MSNDGAKTSLATVGTKVHLARAIDGPMNEAFTLFASGLSVSEVSMRIGVEERSLEESFESAAGRARLADLKSEARQLALLTGAQDLLLESAPSAAACIKDLIEDVDEAPTIRLAASKISLQANGLIAPKGELNVNVNLTKEELEEIVSGVKRAEPPKEVSHRELKFVDGAVKKKASAP